jgi:hypothetical protein
MDIEWLKELRQTTALGQRTPADTGSSENVGKERKLFLMPLRADILSAP